MGRVQLNFVKHCCEDFATNLSFSDLMFSIERRKHLLQNLFPNNRAYLLKIVAENKFVA